MSRIWEKYCYNSLCLFCRVIIRVFESWYNTSARLGVFEKWCSTSAGVATKVANNEAICRITSKTNYKTANRATNRGASWVTNRAPSRAAERVIGKAVNRFSSKTNYQAAVIVI